MNTKQRYQIIKSRFGCDAESVVFTGYANEVAAKMRELATIDEVNPMGFLTPHTKIHGIYTGIIYNAADGSTDVYLIDCE